jgi:hypothetical protein
VATAVSTLKPVKTVPAELVVDSESTSQKISTFLFQREGFATSPNSTWENSTISLVDAKIWLPFRSGLKPRSQVY